MDPAPPPTLKQLNNELEQAFLDVDSTEVVRCLAAGAKLDFTTLMSSRYSQELKELLDPENENSPCLLFSALARDWKCFESILSHNDYQKDYQLHISSREKEHILLAIVAFGGELKHLKLVLEKFFGDLNSIDWNQSDARKRNIFHYAALRGNSSVINFLISFKINLNAKDTDGVSAIQFASHGGNFELVKYLVDSNSFKFDVNYQDNFGNSVLQSACFGGNLQIFKYFIGLGGNLHHQNKQKKNCLHFASQGGNSEIVKYLIDSKFNVNASSISSILFTPLFYALDRQQFGVAEYLLSVGAKINLSNETGKTYLHYFVAKSELWTCDFLIKNGIDVNAVDLEGKTACHDLESVDVEFCTLFLTSGVNFNLKDNNGKIAINYWHLEQNVGRLLCSLSLSSQQHFLQDLNAKFSNGRTVFQVGCEFEGIGDLKSEKTVENSHDCALLLACACANIELFTKMIESGANIQAVTRNGESCLHLAVKSRSISLVRILIEKGMNVNAKDISGKTPLMKISNHKTQVELTNLLLAKGANPKIEDNFGNSALHHAADNGSFEVLKILLDLGMDVNSKNKLGQTVLSHALESIPLISNCIIFLVEKGAKLSIPHKPVSLGVLTELWIGKINNLKEIGCSGIDWRFAVESKMTTESFIENGFDVNEVDENGWTPLFYASAFGTVETLEILIEKGANPDFQNSFGYSALHFAANHQKLENLKFLVNKYKGTIDFDKLIILVMENRKTIEFHYQSKNPLYGRRKFPFDRRERLKILIWLIDRGASVFTRDEKGNTLLELACKVSDWEIVKYLIEGYQQLISNSSRLIEFTCESGSSEILEHLIMKGIPFNDSSKPILFASKFGNRDILYFLEDQKEVNWNCVDENGNNALHLACQEGHLDFAKSLFEKIDVNSRNRFNQTPLMLASKFGRFNVVSKLLKRSEIQANLFDFEFLNAFDYACLRGDLDCVKLLYSKNVRVDSSQAFKCATKGGNHEILSFLLSIGLVIDSENLKKCMGSAYSSKRTEIIEILGKLKSSIPIRMDATGLFAIDRNEISFGQKIGKGGFGKVFKGHWNGQTVAIKQLILKEFSEQAIKDFKHEANILFQLRGPHVVGLLGVINQEPLCLVMEFLERGSLHDYLHSKETIEWNQRIQFVFEIAQGLNHLHTNNVIHRDLKSPNILIDKNYNLKLADFGLASLKEEIANKFQTKSGIVGSWNWIAPELLEPGAKNTNASDIYAFGMVCFEISTRRIPWQGLLHPQLIISVSQGKREIELIPKETPELIKNIMELCWDQHPMKRPPISESLKQLNDNQPKKDNFMIYGKNNLIDDCVSAKFGGSSMNINFKNLNLNMNGIRIESLKYSTTTNSIDRHGELNSGMKRTWESTKTNDNTTESQQMLKKMNLMGIESLKNSTPTNSIDVQIGESKSGMKRKREGEVDHQSNSKSVKK